MPEHKIGSREEWQAAREELARLEAEQARRDEEIKAKRLDLPWVPVDKEYRLDTGDGKKTLAELFDGRSQLLATADSVSCLITWKSRCRPAPVADGSQRQQDSPHQEPQVPDPDVPAQRRPVYASRRVDDTRENEGTKQHVQAAVHHQHRTGHG